MVVTGPAAVNAGLGASGDYAQTDSLLFKRAPLFEDANAT